MTDARSAALAALTGPAITAGPVARVIPTGRVVQAGGDVARVLTGKANLGYATQAGRRRVTGYPGDTIHVSQAQAERLDRLGITALDESEDAPETDDAQLDALSADELKALAGTSAEAATRVLAYESAKAPSKQRPTVIEAAKATLEDDGNA